MKGFCLTEIVEKRIWLLVDASSTSQKAVNCVLLNCKMFVSA